MLADPDLPCQFEAYKLEHVAGIAGDFNHRATCGVGRHRIADEEWICMSQHHLARCVDRSREPGGNSGEQKTLNNTPSSGIIDNLRHKVREHNFRSVGSSDRMIDDPVAIGALNAVVDKRSRLQFRTDIFEQRLDAELGVNTADSENISVAHPHGPGEGD